MSSSPPRAQSISLEQLAILNTEIAALVHAGVPLHLGLLELGRDVPGKLGAIARETGERLSRGEDLIAILRDPHNKLPKAYVAVLEAGVRSGRLPIALQGLASTLRQTLDIHRMTKLAWLYPLTVMVLAYGGLALFCHVTLPAVLEMVEDTPLRPHVLFELLRYARKPNLYLLVALPVLGAVGWMIASWRGSRALRWDASNSSRRVSSRRMRNLGQLATFSEVLALLIEHEVPLPEALPLAANACADRALARDAASLAECLAAGGTGASLPDRFTTVPALIRWSLVGSASPLRLAESLRTASRGFREQAVEIQGRLNFLLPLLLVAVVGGSALLTFAVVSLAPWYILLSELGRPS